MPVEFCSVFDGRSVVGLLESILVDGLVGGVLLRIPRGSCACLEESSVTGTGGDLVFPLGEVAESCLGDLDPPLPLLGEFLVFPDFAWPVGLRAGEALLPPSVRVILFLVLAVL